MIGMAKSDAFFVRAGNTTPGGAYTETSVDLGFAVDALGKSVVRVHNIAAQLYESLGADWSIPANSTANVTWQLTTQSQTGLVDATDKSVIATGQLNIANASTTANIFTDINDSPDILPQQWTKGYLVGVEQIYLGVSVDAQLATGSVNLVMECTVETMTSAAAMALALSQQ